MRALSRISFEFILELWRNENETTKYNFYFLGEFEYVYVILNESRNIESHIIFSFFSFFFRLTIDIQQFQRTV